MPSHTDEEHVDIPPDNQSENPCKEITPATKPETTNPNEEIEIMEVHHHAHDPAAPHHKKNWKNYFWEFLMLFLAVFCGFLAEYQLEHKIERDREKQYIKSMVDDLKTNNTRLEIVINLNKRQLTGLDSLLQNIYQTPYNDSTLRTMYYLKDKYTSKNNNVSFSKGTISQLKNSGGLRLIRKRAVVDSIYTYEFLTDGIEKQADANIYINQKLFEVSVKLFDGELDFGLDQSNLILTSNNKFKLLTTDQKIIKEYANIVKFRKRVLENYLRQLINLQNKIPETIEFLEKEYDLK